ncbi:MAG: phenylacetate--CoA ligase, partial [bacterium]|nr:phenylacetate--CoA ligase [bacterium]
MSYPRYADRDELAADQLVKLRCLLGELVASNAFYGPRIEAAGLDPESVTLDEFTARMTPTSKAEIVADQRRHPPYGSNLTYPMERYVRYSQTSGTTGQPMRWLDTALSWDWMLDHWIRVFEAASVGREDRVLFPFSFGAFLGFWTAFDAAVKM